MLWCLRVDWYRALDKMVVPRRLDRLFHVVLCWEWWAVANYRFAYWATRRSLPDLRRVPILQRLLSMQQAILLRFCYLSTRVVEGLSGARLNATAEIGPGFMLSHSGSCGIGPGVKIGHTFTMYQDASVAGRRGSDPPVVGNNVILFSGARVLGPVQIGDSVRVGANAIVMRDLPSDCTALGVPARPVEAGGKAPDYPAAATLYDLLATLLASGDLEELSTGRYRDKTIGTIFDLTFIQPDGSETAAPEIRILPDP